MDTIRILLCYMESQWIHHMELYYVSRLSIMEYSIASSWTFRGSHHLFSTSAARMRLPRTSPLEAKMWHYPFGKSQETWKLAGDFLIFHSISSHFIPFPPISSHCIPFHPILSYFKLQWWCEISLSLGNFAAVRLKFNADAASTLAESSETWWLTGESPGSLCFFHCEKKEKRWKKRQILPNIHELGDSRHHPESIPSDDPPRFPVPERTSFESLASWGC